MSIAHGGFGIHCQSVALRELAPELGSLEPEAERLWDAIVPELERLRLVSRLDRVTLEALSMTYARWKRHDCGLGYPALTNVLAKLARDVGLAPAARQRMTAPASDPAEERAVFGGHWPGDV